MGEWINRARELGNAAPYSIRIPYGASISFPKVCAGCGEEAVRTQPMARGATDETTMLELPVCEACFKERNGDYFRRKLKMGCALMFALIAGFGGMLAFEGKNGLQLMSWAVAGALLITSYAVGSGAGRGQQVPLLRRRPYIQFHPASMELFASSAFILATYDASPDLRQVK